MTGRGPEGRWWEQGSELAPGRSRPDRLLSTAPQPAVGPGPAPDGPDGAPVPRRRRRWPVVAVAVALVAAAAAVALVVTTREPAPAPTVAARAPGPVVEAPAGAPAITAPRDASAAVAAPCTLLTSDRAGELGYVRWSTRDAEGGGKECTFVAGGDERSLTLSALDGPRGTAFTDTYRDRAGVFTPIEVGGLPAVVTQRFVGSQLCRITVGVADGQSLRADTTTTSDANDVPTSDPCGHALRGVEAAVAGLPR